MLFSALSLEVWTLCLDLTLLHLSSCSHFFFITADSLPLLCASDVWHFVIRSALFCFVLMYPRFVNFFSTTSCTYMYFSITCFIIPSPLLDAHAFAHWLSTWFMGVTSWPNSCNMCFVTIPSATPVVRAYNSASAKLKLTVCCVRDHAVSVAFHHCTTSPLVPLHVVARPARSLSVYTCTNFVWMLVVKVRMCWVNVFALNQLEPKSTWAKQIHKVTEWQLKDK